MDDLTKATSRQDATTELNYMKLGELRTIAVRKRIERVKMSFKDGTSILFNAAAMVRMQSMAMESARPHALVIPFPAQGHVFPFLELSHCLIDRGFRITFLNTEFNHDRVTAALSKTNGGGLPHSNLLRMAAIPDGMQPGEDRGNVGQLIDSILTHMPGGLEKLICNINQSEEGDKITCIIVDGTMSWAFPVAAKLGIEAVAFWTAAVEFWRVCFQIPELLEVGIIDANGFPTKEQTIKHSPAFPAMPASELPWLSVGDRSSQNADYRLLSQCGLALKFTDCLLCNTCSEIESTACELLPKVRAIGPLLGGRRLGRLEGNFWQEDSTCLSWLDQQPPNSVIYVAFGSFTVFDRHQFQELALGLELCNRTFLWVVRPDQIADASADGFPEGFKSRIASRGYIVDWCPQQKVLAHPSISCFVTHCGWNSTTEGLNHGLPFLCWPYFGDQKLNLTYICDVWNVGLAFEKDSNGIVSRGEIKRKIEALLGDEGIKQRSLDIKEIVRSSVAEGGSSFKNFNDFVETIKSVSGTSISCKDD